MEILYTVKETISYLDYARSNNQSIGFVPTMGALHAGHLALVKRARRENDIVACSIFINPIQFNNPEDLKKYPRTPDEDLRLLESEKCDLVFVPSEQEMYPEKVTKKYKFGAIENVMEGRFRPGHFNGVAVVVKRLFDIIGPGRAYFGQKDFQQLVIIKSLVRIESLPVKIIPCPTVREEDGLAMSSRNLRLSLEERAIAPEIYKTLLEMKEHAGILPVEEVKEKAILHLERKGIRVEYVEIADTDTLQPVSDWKFLQDRRWKMAPSPQIRAGYPGLGTDPSIAAFIACYLGTVRLIDNMILFYNFAGR
jgi:pantoate--beta-alanine ligase